MRSWPAVLILVAATIGCTREASTPAAAAAAPAQPKLGIRPNGDTEIAPDMAKIQSEELKKVFAYIDEHIDEHVINLQKWIRQPSISNSGEGIPESAEMVKGFFEQLGCQESRVYDVGTTEWGAQGNPVVYASCDEGAPRTLVIYWMYDTMPVTQPDVWIAPPFEGAPRRAGAVQESADRPRRDQLQGAADGRSGTRLMAIKAVTGKLPVNLDLRRRRRRRADVDRLPPVREGSPRALQGRRSDVSASRQSRRAAAASVGGGSEGCVYVELTTSGAKWGRGPTVRTSTAATSAASTAPRGATSRC